MPPFPSSVPRIALCVAGVLAISVCSDVHSAFAARQAARPVVRVAVLIDGPGASNDEITGLMTAEIVAVNERRLDIVFLPAAQRVGDWTAASVRDELHSLLADPDVDAVLAMGVIAGAVAMTIPDLPKPVIAPFAIDPELGGLELTTRRTADGRTIRVTGIPNLSLTVPSWNLERDVAEFHRWVPFTKAAFLIDERLVQAIPEVRQRLEALTAVTAGAAYQIVPVGDEAASALAVIAEDADAAVVGVLLNVPDHEVTQLLEGLAARGLPSFSLLGRPDVERGAMLGLAAETELQRLARRTAIHLQRILLGDDAGLLPVDMPVATRLTFNRSTARAVGFAASWDLLTAAEILDPARADIERELTLDGVVRAALERNLELRIIESEVRAGESTIDSARAALRPQAGISTTGVWIDSDRAEASFGAQAGRTWSAALSGSWLILSDAARAGVDVAGLQQEALRSERDSQRLDVVQQAAVAFLSVIRAGTVERIRRQNLDVTRFNLELARQRRSAGASTAADEARWESEIALDQQELIEAIAIRNQAEIALNRLLSEPLEEPFVAREDDLEGFWRSEYQEPLERFLGTQEGFDVFREFMAIEAMRNSPELAQIDHFIAAQRRVLLATRRSFWHPDVSLQGQVSRRLSEGGAGTGEGGGFAFPGQTRPDDTEWNLLVSASLPVYAGGFRFSERQRALDDLERLQRQRRAVAERIEQRTRSEMHAAGASWAAIGLTARAAEAAHRNLELVQDAYSQGLATVIQLVDGQNAALVADLAAENALHDHLVDLFNVERSVADFRILASREDRIEWHQRLQDFFESRRETSDGR